APRRGRRRPWDSRSRTPAAPGPPSLGAARAASNRLGGPTLMNGEIAQMVALTCHGNALLRGLPGAAFFPLNSTFQHCDQVSFVELYTRLFRRPGEKEVAETPDQWFQYLQRLGARGLRLSCTPQNEPNFSDRETAGMVGGGGIWVLEA